MGSLLVEVVTERRKVKVNVPALLDAFQGKNSNEIMDEISNSHMFTRQKLALNEIIKHSHLPAVSHEALARQLLASEELHYARITNRTDLVARLGPMLGLMATRFHWDRPYCLGQGDTKTLADSLLTAFDATVTGWRLQLLLLPFPVYVSGGTRIT